MGDARNRRGNCEESLTKWAIHAQKGVDSGKMCRKFLCLTGSVE